MRLLLTEIERERDTVSTIVQLSTAFEGIASMRIAQIKDQVQLSERFFDELWKIYNQIRVDELFHFGRRQSVEKVVEKELLILITSEGSLSGSIDQDLVNKALKAYKPDKNDIIIIGHHGETLLRQKAIPYIRSFQLPERDQNINVTPLVIEAQKYVDTTVYYQRYQSLMNQNVKTIRLAVAVAERGRAVAPGEDIISETNYIFEPSPYAVVDHLERSMMQITLSEVILESKLAQYASRFRAMSLAHNKATESFDELNLLFSRGKRRLKDERLKEIMNATRGTQL